jgi:hypothetical protein
MTDPTMRGHIFQARRNVFQPHCIKIQARDNEVQAGRNEIKMAFPSAIWAFSKIYADVCRLSPLIAPSSRLSTPSLVRALQMVIAIARILFLVKKMPLKNFSER